jgi:hypothetical protein
MELDRESVATSFSEKSIAPLYKAEVFVEPECESRLFFEHVFYFVYAV